MSNKTGVISETVYVYSSGGHDINPGFRWGSCCSIFSFFFVICILLLIFYRFLGGGLFAMELSVQIRLVSCVSLLLGSDANYSHNYAIYMRYYRQENTIQNRVLNVFSLTSKQIRYSDKNVYSNAWRCQFIFN